MNLVKRIKNIWKLGEFEGIIPYMEKSGQKPILVNKPDLTQGKVTSMMAQIISMKPQEDEIEELLKDNQEQNENNSTK